MLMHGAVVFLEREHREALLSLTLPNPQTSAFSLRPPHCIFSSVLISSRSLLLFITLAPPLGSVSLNGLPFD